MHIFEIQNHVTTNGLANITSYEKTLLKLFIELIFYKSLSGLHDFIIFNMHVKNPIIFCV